MYAIRSYYVILFCVTSYVNAKEVKALENSSCGKPDIYIEGISNLDVAAYNDISVNESYNNTKDYVSFLSDSVPAPLYYDNPIMRGYHPDRNNFV